MATQPRNIWLIENECHLHIKWTHITNKAKYNRRFCPNWRLAVAMAAPSCISPSECLYKSRVWGLLHYLGMAGQIGGMSKTSVAMAAPSCISPSECLYKLRVRGLHHYLGMTGQIGGMSKTETPVHGPTSAASCTRQKSKSSELKVRFNFSVC